MAELNFVVDQTALDTIKNTQLSANFAEMKEALTEFIEPYAQLIVNEDAITEAKADRAKINAVAKHVDDYRKLVKKVYTEPLKQFEDKMFLSQKRATLKAIPLTLAKMWDT